MSSPLKGSEYLLRYYGHTEFGLGLPASSFSNPFRFSVHIFNRQNKSIAVIYSLDKEGFLDTWPYYVSGRGYPAFQIW